MARADVGFDDIIYRLQENRGASVYWRHLGSEVARQRPDWAITHREGSPPARFGPVPTRARVFHSSLFRVGVGLGVRNVVTIHDLAYEKGLVPGRRAKVGRAQRRLAVGAAAGFVFISATTRDEFARCYPRAVHKPWVVAWHGRETDWDVPASAALPDGLERGQYVLHVGHRAGYKNFDHVLAGFARSTGARDGRTLVVVGPPLTDGETQQVANFGVAVRWIAAPDRATLGAVLGAAGGLVYLSREEGFGMPLVEAMQLGVPVLAARASCLPEVGGDAVTYADPDDLDAVAGGLDALFDPAHAARLSRAGRQRAQQFSWERSARAHIELYERLGAGGRST